MIKFERAEKASWTLVVLGFLVFLAAAPAPGSGAPAADKRTLTLDECVGLAIENSKVLHASSLRVESARAVAGVVAENVSQVRRHLQDVENLLGSGLLTRNEVLRVKVQLSQVEMLRIEADNAVELASLWLNSVIGLPLDQEIEIPAEAADTEIRTPAALEPATCDEWVRKALENRPELKAMDYRVRAAESGLAVARSSWYPQVFFAGNYTLARPNQRILPSKDRFYDTWDFSVSVSMELWNWGMTSCQTAQAKAQIAQAQDGLGQIRDGVTIEVRSAWLALDGAGRKVAVAAESVLQADENLRVTLDRFKDGIALNADVLDAEVALLQAKTALAQAQADRALARARLAKTAGQVR